VTTPLEYPRMSDLTAGFPEAGRKKKIARFRWLVIVAISIGAILFQIYIPRFLTYLAYLELPLLVTVYFSLMRRSPVAGVFFGAGIGLAQDSLSANPLGMFGIVKTLVGYFAASVSQRFDVERWAVRSILAFFFYFFHQFLYWVLVRALLGQPLAFDPQRETVLAVLNAAVAVPLFHLFDRLRVTE
jgi:rod shape-determining protein MreD